MQQQLASLPRPHHTLTANLQREHYITTSKFQPTSEVITAGAMASLKLLCLADLVISFCCITMALLTPAHGAGGKGIQLIVVNNCNESVWPGLLGTVGHPTPQSGGFHLAPGDEAAFEVPLGWSGRVWPRRGCSFDARGRGSCATGDCAGLLRCSGRSGAPPATVVEMTLGTPRSPLHFYDVSLVDGFNAPASVAPVGGGAGCGVGGCGADLNACCPSALEVRDAEGRVTGCRSACRAMGGDRYCCTGEYASQERCKPSMFSRVFKAVCPKAYSYAYDDATSLNRCKANRYLITFCPPPTSRK